MYARLEYHLCMQPLSIVSKKAMPRSALTLESSSANTSARQIPLMKETFRSNYPTFECFG